MKNFKMLINGEWIDGNKRIEVINPFDNSAIGTVPEATEEDLDRAIITSMGAFINFQENPAYERADILEKASQLISKNRQILAESISKEAGKALKFSLGEVDRAAQTFKCAAEEAKRISGEIISLDAAPGGEKRFGYFIREPIGVIGAITPFNFPLNLVSHKIAPAIACGNTVILKPASSTPLTAIKLGELLIEAGLPKGILNIIFGSGSTVGERLVCDDRLSMITFTGSPSVGKRIKNQAGLKKVTLELGNNSAVIIDKRLDYKKNLPRFMMSAFANSGQMCISLQRIYIQKDLYSEFVDKFISQVKTLKIGNPLDPEVDVGPMIDQKEVQRIESWVKEAKDSGAKILCGGKREGNIYYPTVLVDVNSEAKVITEEAFAPIVSITHYENFDEALEIVNRSKYGLQSGVFTDDTKKAFEAIKRLKVGGVMINDIPTFRADHMPYGGVKESGLGREGPRFAIEEMTDIKMICFNLN